MSPMRRVVLLGRGGAGKSTFARRLSEITGIPAVELDKHFWSDVLEPLGPQEWSARQAALVAGERWILDGDLGPHDVLEPGCGTRTRSWCSTTPSLEPPGGRHAGRVRGRTSGDGCALPPAGHDPTSATRWPFTLRTLSSTGCQRRDRHDNYSPASAATVRCTDHGRWLRSCDDTT